MTYPDPWTCVLDLIDYMFGPVVHSLVDANCCTDICVHDEPVNSSGGLAKHIKHCLHIPDHSARSPAYLPDWNLKAMLLEPYCLMWSICHLTISRGGSLAVKRAM